MAAKEILGSVALAFGMWFLNNQAKAATARMDPARARELIARINDQEHGGWFNTGDVLAIIEIESSFNPNAQRHEPHLKDYSLGLMQLLFSTARDRGLTGGPASLYDPEVNIRLGMRQLKWSWDYLARKLGRTPTTHEWIGSYNAGVGNVAIKGFIPQGYVNKWLSARRRYV